MRKHGGYVSWKERIRRRDKYTCQICGSKIQPQIHHILGYSKHPSLRGTDWNSIVLCKDCHVKYHQLYTGEDINPYTFVQFMKQQRRAII